MALIIRPMALADAKGYVHWKSWQETYPGLIDTAYLARMTLERCWQWAREYPENTLLAELDGKVVGFSCYSASRSTELPDCGEVVAIYVLQEAQGLGIGRKLMDAAIAQLPAYDKICLWALKGNDRAIGFYEHYGFRLDGASKDVVMGTPNVELRLIYTRRFMDKETVDFDLFLSQLILGKYIDETNFYIDGDPEYDCCFLGYIPTCEQPYWYGLVHDGSQAYEFDTALELMDAKVFHGKSLRELWPRVRFYTIGGVEVSQWLQWRKR